LLLKTIKDLSEKVFIIGKLETALARFNDGFACSQVVLAAFAPQLGMSEEIAIKIAGAFGGGVARRGDTCGAVNAAFMVIGLKYADNCLNRQATKKAYTIVREFVNSFETLNGSIVCRDLINCDISTSQGFTYAKDNQLFNKLCPKFIQDSIEILDRLIE
jgi:C_GCAxxG_C_C family probable redox protein